ncbi:MAG: DUF5685 family protein [Anaerovorax sp.]
MLGYILPEKPEMKVRELELYQAYYCGICRSIGKRYGQLPRFTLNYDSVLLSLMVAADLEEEEQIQRERCIAHPLKKRSMLAENGAIDYAADIMLVLAYFKFKDDCEDEHIAVGYLGKGVLSGAMKKLKKRYPEKCQFIEEKLQELACLEKEKCGSLDPIAQPFAAIMEEIFSFGSKENLFRKFGYHLGKWIYLIDAYDDLEEDATHGNYNPLLQQFQYNKNTQEGIQDFKERILERTEFNLLCYLTEMTQAYEKMGVTKNSGIIENILYFGMHRKTEEVLRKQIKNEGEKNHAEPI